METAPSPADEPPSRSIFARPWFWIVAGAVVAGSVAAVVIATRPSACQATLCIKE
jgi:hypothetical protein